MSVFRKFTFNRYSTARSGLKKAARIARSISALGNPILSILAIASSRCEPGSDGSLKLAPGAAVEAGAGDGVAGAFGAGPGAGAGAAGGAGVEAGAGAGVDGAFEVDEDEAGAALGFI